MAKSAATPLPAAYHGAAELLIGQLATVEAEAKALEAKAKELRQNLLALFTSEGATTYRSVWGLVTVSQTVSYSYSDNVVAAEIALKAQRETERKLNVAKVADSKPKLTITYSK